MQNKIVKIGNIDVANDKPFVLFGGMNVLESRDMAMQVCEAYVKVTEKLGVPYVLRHLSIKLTVLQFILTVVQAWKKV